MGDNPNDELRRQIQNIMGPFQQMQSKMQSMNSQMAAPLRQMQSKMQSMNSQMAAPLRQMQISLDHLRRSGAFFSREELSKMLNENSALISHMTLYKNILDTIDEESFERIQDVFEEELHDVFEEELHNEENNSLEEEIKIVYPSFYNAGVTINTYVLVTDNQINTNKDISAEERSVWEKRIKPALILIGNLFMIWATSNTPIKEWNIFEPFQKVANIIENYEYPLETTDIEIDYPTDIKDNEKNE
jgi:hypothetical protein